MNDDLEIENVNFRKLAALISFFNFFQKEKKCHTQSRAKYSLNTSATFVEATLFLKNRPVHYRGKASTFPLQYCIVASPIG